MQTFMSKGYEFQVVKIKEHTQSFKDQLNWTHFAAVKRPKGRKIYYTNLYIIEDKIVKSNVVF